MPVLQTNTSQYYPTLELILGLVRSLANDSFSGATSTPGEGQILTDLQGGAGTAYNPMLLNTFNSAIREMYRKLRNVGAPALIRDNFILTGLPVVHGPSGASVADPSVQCNLTFAGFFDGSNLNAGFTLPPDLTEPLMLWERQTGTATDFYPMVQPSNGLDPRNQHEYFRDWEWREGQINFVGCLNSQDLRIRYMAVLPTFFPNPASANYFSSTQIPIFDCEEAVAYLTLKKIATALGSRQYPQIKSEADEAMFDLKTETVRRSQSKRFQRRPSGGEDIFDIGMS